MRFFLGKYSHYAFHSYYDLFNFYQLEKDHSMIETPCLKNVVIFIQTILSFVLSRKIINIYNDIARKYRNVRVKDFQKYEKLEYKKNKLK